MTNRCAFHNPLMPSTGWVSLGVNGTLIVLVIYIYSSFIYLAIGSIDVSSVFSRRHRECWSAMNGRPSYRISLIINTDNTVAPSTIGRHDIKVRSNKCDRHRCSTGTAFKDNVFSVLGQSARMYIRTEGKHANSCGSSHFKSVICQLLNESIFNCLVMIIGRPLEVLSFLIFISFISRGHLERIVNAAECNVVGALVLLLGTPV